MKVKLNSNMITGVLFLIVSVALHILIPSQIRTYETSAVTAATVPTLLIRGMILCSVILLVQGIHNGLPDKFGLAHVIIL